MITGYTWTVTRNGQYINRVDTNKIISYWIIQRKIRST